MTSSNSSWETALIVQASAQNVSHIDTSYSDREPHTNADGESKDGSPSDHILHKVRPSRPDQSRGLLVVPVVIG
jgi:hypothetical protein